MSVAAWLFFCACCSLASGAIVYLFHDATRGEALELYENAQYVKKWIKAEIKVLETREEHALAAVLKNIHDYL